MADLYRIVRLPDATVIELVLPDMIDADEFDRINESVLAVIDGRAAEQWVIDLSAVSYMGSAMLGLFVNIRQRIKAANGRLVLCSMSPRLADIFRACSMERLFKIVRDRPEALRSFS